MSARKTTNLNAVLTSIPVDKVAVGVLKQGFHWSAQKEAANRDDVWQETPLPTHPTASDAPKILGLRVAASQSSDTAAQDHTEPGGSFDVRAGCMATGRPSPCALLARRSGPCVRTASTLRS